MQDADIYKNPLEYLEMLFFCLFKKIQIFNSDRFVINFKEVCHE